MTQRAPNNRSNRIVNDAGILQFNTWRYYINRFGCCHFKGRGIEDNYYLLRPIYLNNGDKVNTRAKFFIALQESPLREGFEYIVSDHQAAVDTAKLFYHPEVCNEDDVIIWRNRLRFYELRNLEILLPQL
jgi:hypothetical protein